MAYRVAWDTNYNHPLPAHHRFPMRKYDMLPHFLIQSNIVNPDDLFSPRIVDDETILLSHSYGYLTQLRELSLSRRMIRESGFPLSQALVEREVRILSGTVECTKYALESGVAFNVAGGTHHAFRDRPEGFCLLNDQAVAAAHLLERSLAKQVLIIDLDVHQGNGTASIFKDESRVFTFSMHGERNYPFRKEKSDLDINLPDETTDDEYLQTLQTSLTYIRKSINPDFIFFQAGVDVLESDVLGKLSLSIEGCRMRDRLVFEFAKSMNIPIVVCMGGGYSKDIDIIIEAHANTFIEGKIIH